jgi:beta-lactamase class D
MKTVNLSEEAYKKLINEIGYGNDDLSNLFNEIGYSIDDALQVVRDHLIMCDRLKQQPNSVVMQINEHLESIKKLVESSTAI